MRRRRGHPRRLFAFHGHYIVPGFIDVHVHGVDGVDTLDGPASAVAAIAARLPRYGVTAFCPTTVACAPDDAAPRARAGAPRARDAAAARRRACCRRTSRAISSTPNSAARSRSGCLRSPRAALAGRRQVPHASPRRRTTGSPPPTSSRRSSARRRRRHRHARAGARRRPRSDPLADVRAGIASRSATPARPTRRRWRRSRPARARRRISSTACRRSTIARRVWSARCCRPTRSPPSSSATASTCIRRWCGRRSPRKGRRASWRSPTAPPRAGLPPGRVAIARRPADHGRRAAALSAATARWPAAS